MFLESPYGECVGAVEESERWRGGLREHDQADARLTRESLRLWLRLWLRLLEIVPVEVWEGRWWISWPAARSDRILLTVFSRFSISSSDHPEICNAMALKFMLPF